MKIIVIIAVLLALTLNAEVSAQTPTQTATFNLSWTDNSSTPQEAGFAVEMCAGAGCANFAEVGRVGQDVVQYQQTITNDTGGNTFCFRVKAYSNTPNVNDSAYSGIVCGVTPAVPPVQLNPPSDLRITAVTTAEITLAWRNDSINHTAQRMDWRQWQPPDQGMVYLAPDTQVLIMAGLKKNTPYCATVSTIAGSHESAPSNEACGATLKSR